MTFYFTDLRELYLANLDGWAKNYVEGRWSLEKFERHADLMREGMFPLHPSEDS